MGIKGKLSSHPLGAPIRLRTLSLIYGRTRGGKSSSFSSLQLPCAILKKLSLCTAKVFEEKDEIEESQFQIREIWGGVLAKGLES